MRKLTHIPKDKRVAWVDVPEVGSDENLRWQRRELPDRRLDNGEYWHPHGRIVRMTDRAGSRSTYYEVLHPTKGWLPVRTHAPIQSLWDYTVDHRNVYLKAMARIDEYVLRQAQVEFEKKVDSEYCAAAAVRFAKVVGIDPKKIKVEMAKPANYWGDTRDTQTLHVVLTKRQLRDISRWLEYRQRAFHQLVIDSYEGSGI